MIGLYHGAIFKNDSKWKERGGSTHGTGGYVHHPSLGSSRMATPKVPNRAWGFPGTQWGWT